MTLWSGPFLPFVALAWPLLVGLMAAVPGRGGRALRLLPLAPLPALWLALAGQEGGSQAPDLLLGVSLVLDPARRLMLGMTAGLWMAAGLFAQSMNGGQRLQVFAGFWCLTLTGNLGVMLADDAMTFYIAFTAVSLASWFLIVHTRKPDALGAGRVYILLAVLGEVALFVGLLIGVNAADDLAIDAVRAALSQAPAGGVAVALLIVGFGIKLGMIPLHVWLPLAHPAAPVAASAVLSGAIVKAGLVGFWLFLPPGSAATILIALGLAGAFGAALWGLTQTNPKAVLAYSTISQMGVMLALFGGGAGALPVAFHALHHGLAKGALFLAVGAASARVGWIRTGVFCVAVLAAASIAGLPPSGGGAAKAVVKYDLSDGLALLIAATGVSTALIMGWFLWRLRCQSATDDIAAHQVLPAIVLALLALVLPWIVWPAALPAGRGYVLGAGALAEGALPILFAAMIAMVAVAMRWRLPSAKPGDLLTLMPDPSRYLGLFSARSFAPSGTALWHRAASVLPGSLFEQTERALRLWRCSGAIALVLVVLLFGALY
ncbi:MAG: Formate hydrogenlyase subunit 3/Multisubunit Na+/H+ antiporter, MnhD subunit [Rhodobacteraceae bacterium HLUCCA12]|nr:MAG: Formate hydrogenlyase subunit 3/Multisubunit Na+/H+ antiporter, MnhD subunit [Rhodobacteraceae bacterium HLUCCA12]